MHKDFIQKTEFKADLERMKTDLASILEMNNWDHENQISLRHTPNAENKWMDGIGSLNIQRNNPDGLTESNFSVWNEQLPSYTKYILTSLEEDYNFTAGRARLMLLPPKRGLTVHYDTETRYHFVFETNNFSYFGLSENEGDAVATCYHIPADGHFYHVDTRRVHFVYNGGKTDRIHLVICALKNE